MMQSRVAAGSQPLLAGMRSSTGPRKAQDLFGDGGIRVRAATAWPACLACSAAHRCPAVATRRV